MAAGAGVAVETGAGVGTAVGGIAGRGIAVAGTSVAALWRLEVVVGRQDFRGRGTGTSVGRTLAAAGGAISVRWATGARVGALGWPVSGHHLLRKDGNRQQRGHATQPDRRANAAPTTPTVNGRVRFGRTAGGIGDHRRRLDLGVAVRQCGARRGRVCGRRWCARDLSELLNRGAGGGSVPRATGGSE